MNRASSILRWTALAALLFTALLRAQSTRARLPYWDLDPTRVQVPETARLYSHGFLLDALVWLAAALTIVGESLTGRRIHWRSGILVLVGAVGVALHGYILPPPGATPGGPLKGDFMGLALGSAWAAAMVGGWTVLHLARDEQMRRTAALALFSFAAVLVAKGAYQVYIEHAYTISAYKKDPAGMLAAQGLAEGSTAAKEYERRLFQPEPVGWFGLSNVYATFVAASFIFFLGLSIGAWKLVKEKAITSGPAGALSLAALASLFGLALSGSKGGWGAAIAGGVVLLLGSLSRSALRMGEVDGRSGPAGEGSVAPSSPSHSSSFGFFSRLSPIAHCLLPIALCLLTLLAVALRGAIGERLTELSLLFRWHYLVAATRIFASESLFGVGPAGFKNAYALHKVPINPEMVESPHSVFFDWTATLGAFGLCWCFVLIWLLLRVGSSLVTKPEPRHQKSEHWRSYAPVIAAAALASIVAWAREFPIVTPDEWPVRLIALGVCIAFIVIGTKIAALAPRAFSISLAAAASVVAVHSMIEMTPTQPGSCVWVLAVIGLAAGKAGHARRGSIRPLVILFLAQVPLAGLLGNAAKSYPIARRYESQLALAAENAHCLMLLQQSPSDESESQRAKLINRASSNLECSVRYRQEMGDTSSDAIMLDARDSLLCSIKTVFESLGRAIAFDNFEKLGPAPMTDAVEPYLKFTAAFVEAVDSRTGFNRDFATGIFGVNRHYGHSVRIKSAQAARLESVAPLFRGEDFRQYSLASWLHVTQLDPYSLTPALNAYRLARELNDFDTAYHMAELALRNNDYLRLDPLKQLDPAQVAELKAFLASETPNPAQTTPLGPAIPPPPT